MMERICCEILIYATDTQLSSCPRAACVCARLLDQIQRRRASRGFFPASRSRYRALARWGARTITIMLQDRKRRHSLATYAGWRFHSVCPRGVLLLPCWPFQRYKRCNLARDQRSDPSIHLQAAQNDDNGCTGGIMTHGALRRSGRSGRPNVRRWLWAHGAGSASAGFRCGVRWLSLGSDAGACRILR